MLWNSHRSAEVQPGTRTTCDTWLSEWKLITIAQNTAVQETNVTALTLLYVHFLQALAELSVIIYTAIEEIFLHFG